MWRKHHWTTCFLCTEGNLNLWSSYFFYQHWTVLSFVTVVLGEFPEPHSEASGWVNWVKLILYCLNVSSHRRGCLKSDTTCWWGWVWPGWRPEEKKPSRFKLLLPHWANWPRQELICGFDPHLKTDVYMNEAATHINAVHSRYASCSGWSRGASGTDEASL